MGQRHERCGRRVGKALVGDLDLGHTNEAVPIAQRPVADEKAFGAGGLQVAVEIIGGHDLWFGHPLKPTGYLAIEGGEQFTAAGVDRGDDEAPGVAHRERHQIEAAHPDHRHAEPERGRQRRHREQSNCHRYVDHRVRRDRDC